MALRRHLLQEDDILHELYAGTCSDVSDYHDNESLDSVSDVSAASSHKELRSSTGPLTQQFPHPYLITSIKTMFISVRLAQTLLSRNMRVCGIMRANRDIPCELEGEGKCLKKETLLLWRNGYVMV